ncbi:MAG: hypothetical protein Q7S19_00355 [bacterium]|nr:hypothetical protein [bacterium]
MTCVVALVHNNLTVVGADSLCTYGDNAATRNDVKFFKIKQVKSPDVMIAFDGDYRAADLMRSLRLPEQKELTLDREVNRNFLILKMVPAMQKLFKRGNYKAGEEEIGSNFLICYRNWVYEIGMNYSIQDPALPFAAIGVGFSYALGAMHHAYLSADFGQMDPAKIVIDALEISAEHCHKVRGPMKWVPVSHIEIPNHDTQKRRCSC